LEPLAFFNGKESPTTETAKADFNVLSIRMRGYHDFGVALQDASSTRPKIPFTWHEGLGTPVA